MSAFVFMSKGDASDPLAEFRDICREMGGHDSPNPIKDIVLVGALLCNEGEPSLGLSFYDKLHLQAALADYREAGIFVASDFNLTVLNIAYGKDQDFLDRSLLPVPADLLVICYVYNPSVILDYVFERKGSLAISPNHFDEDIWGERANATGAQIIKIIGGDKTEVAIHHFAALMWGEEPAYVKLKAPKLLHRTPPLAGQPLLIRRDVVQTLALV